MNGMQWLLISEILGVMSRAATRHGAAPAIPMWLSAVQAYIERGNATRIELNAFKAHIQQMVIEDREPTEGEWGDLVARSASAHEAIQSIDLSDEGLAEAAEATAVSAFNNGVSAPEEPSDEEPSDEDSVDDILDSLE